MESVPETKEEAIALAKQKEPIPIGVFYKTNQPVYHEELFGDWNPVTQKMGMEERREKIKDFLKV
jgi:hypothetical protein